jgi:5-methylcytosine-specific restriction enzyme subunit McrC
MRSIVLFEGEDIEVGALRDRCYNPGLNLAAHLSVDDALCIVDALCALSVKESELTLDEPKVRGSLAGYDEFDDDNPYSRQVATRYGKNGLKVGNLIGSFRLKTDGSSPDCQIEILPKVRVGKNQEASELTAARMSLRRMWSFATDLKTREDQSAVSNEVFRDLPLHEWLLKRFVKDLEDLLAKGLRSRYIEEEGNLATLRGRLMVGENIRRNIFNPARFQCRFDNFSLARPENRLIRSAIDLVDRYSINPDTIKKVRRLRDMMTEIPRSTNEESDFVGWAKDRSMLHYLPIRQTCEWLLRKADTAPIAGQSPVTGRLARMNDVFERYVQRWLASHCSNGFDVILDETRNRVLASVGERRLLTMRPDLVVQRSDDGENVAVLDMKWKSLTPQKPVSREDLYQLYAYAKSFLGSSSDRKLLAGVYPCSDGQHEPIEFQFHDMPELRCFALPFSLPIAADDRANIWFEGFRGCESTIKTFAAVGLGEAFSKRATRDN